MTACPRCGAALPHEALASLQALECPACGANLTRGRGIGVLGQIINAYLSDVWLPISRPAAFFKKMPTEGGWSRPIAFALITHWLGTSLEFLWNLAIATNISTLFDQFFSTIADIMEVDHPGRGGDLVRAWGSFSSWFQAAGPVVIDPFWTLLSILVSAFLIFIGARLLVPPQSGSPVTYESTLRVVCFGMTPAILAALPIVGPVLASLGTILVTAVGAREVYRVSMIRGFLIALFPKLLFMGVFFLGTLGLLVAIFQIISSFFIN